MLFAAEFHNAVEHRQHPRRHAAEVGDVLVHGLTCNAVALHLEIAQQCCFFRRHTHKIGQRVDVLDENGAEIADQRARYIVVGLMASAEDETASVEHAALRVVSQVESHDIATALVMQPLQSLFRNRYELRLIIGCAARLGIPFHLARPEYIRFAMTHAVNALLQFLIRADRR